METVYHFGSLLRASYFRVATKSPCDHNKLRNGEYDLGIQFPVICRHTQGKKMMDMVDMEWGSLYLISDRIRDAFIENNITGWKTYPVKIYDKKENEILGYNGFSITGRCKAEISYDSAEIIMRKYVENGPMCKIYKGATIDLNQWDGCDFFMPERSSHILCTERVVELVLKNEFTNIRLEKLHEREVDSYIVDEFYRKKN